MARVTAGGFSLIELLVVVAIIGILSALIYPNVSGSRAKARDAQRVSDIAQFQLAISLYYDRCGVYPEGGDTALTTSTNNGCPTGITFGTFMSSIPVPPSGAGQAAYDYATAGSSYTAPTGYILHATLESYNAAVAKGLSSRPAGYTSANNNSFTCSTGSTPPIQYCVSP
jgi:prepilin-type N-terminal cleavage/methylation domain-containing protein